MTAQIRGASLPFIHDVDRGKAKLSGRSYGSVGLRSRPLTPSTVASSKTRPSTAASSRTRPSTAASVRDRQASCSLSRRQRPVGPEAVSRVDVNSAAERAMSIGTSMPRRARPDLWPDVETLLHGIRLDVVFGEGESVEYMYELIQDGQDVNQISKRGFTPLAVAAAGGSAPLVSLLLEKKANAAVASLHRAELPVHYAAYLGDQVMFQLLLAPTQKAAMLDAASSAGWTPLHFAAAGGHEGIARTLLRAKVLPDRSNPVFGGHTAVHLAAVHGHPGVLDLLLDYDGDANMADALKRTPLHFAALRAHASCVAVLLRHHADPHRQAGGSNATAMDLVHAGASDRIHRLLAAYTRPPPALPRTDRRFDLPGGHDILSEYAYTQPSWSIRGNNFRQDDSGVTCEGGDDAVWL